MGLEILENVQVTKFMVWRIGLSLIGACLKGLHLVVDEMARGNLPSAGYELKNGVKRSASKGGDGKGADNGGAM